MYCIQLYSNAWPFLTSMTSLDIHTPLRSSGPSPGTTIHDKQLPVPSPLYRQSHRGSEKIKLRKIQHEISVIGAFEQKWSRAKLAAWECGV